MKNSGVQLSLFDSSEDLPVTVPEKIDDELICEMLLEVNERIKTLLDFRGCLQKMGRNSYAEIGGN